ncbi:AbrB/MazE/SpoVT family DNA-binding domain-containing protein [Candidatus Pacearchaeota archaeon]|nr:AbrB/MazE/SpoVT family DNA-binding domain-containing protein [Candidatus Pacearchaeota archaeon]
MAVIETEVKKWGNSFGIVIPKETIERENIREKMKIKIIIVKESRKALKSSFGIGKGKIIKSGQQIKDELRRELY